MPGRSIRVGRLAGIPIGFSPFWLLIVGLITWSLGATYYPDRVDGIASGAAYALGLLSALLLFASILLHELGHALVARRHGVEVEEIDLWLLGGVARMHGSPHEPRDELRYAAAGPLVTLGIALAFGVAALALQSTDLPALRAVIEYQALVNGAILVFNLMPAFPLDGGRILRALLWRRSGDQGAATRVAAGIGRIFGWVLVALGVLSAFSGAPGGIWLALVGGFVILAAGAEERGGELRAAFAGKTAAQLMSFPAVTVPADWTVAQARLERFGRHPYTAFPVVDAAGRPVGVLGVTDVERVPPEAGARTRVADVAQLDPELLVDGGEDVAALLERPAFLRVGRAVVLAGDGAIGILSVTDVERALRSRRLTAGARAGAA